MRQVLKIKIHQPDAHFRIPFSYRRRFTYPIPPYSTVKGLICNLMGIKSDKDEVFKNLQSGLSMCIYGDYESIIKEYTWFRNLQKKSHIDKFNSITNRIIDNTPQHPGGQMPVTVDVLHNVELIIYIYHPDLLNDIRAAFENPVNRLSTIHLGRSEDWIIVKETKILNDEDFKREKIRNIPFFTWIPSPKHVDEKFACNIEQYQGFYDKVSGNIFKLPTYYIISDNNQRIFTEYVEVKLFEKGGIVPQEFYTDSSEGLALIMSKIGKRNGNNFSKE